MSNQSGGYVKLWRKLQKSDMYQSLTAKQRDILIQLLLMANHEPHQWVHGGKTYEVLPGQFVTSLESIKKNCAKDVSIQNIRTCLVLLLKWQFLTNKSTNKNRIITICNWEKYQGELTNNQHVDQQSTNKQLTTNKNDIRMIKNKEELNTYTSDQLGLSSPQTVDPPKHELLDLWFEITRVRIHLNLPENIRDATYLLKELGLDDLRRAIETTRMIKADTYAKRTLQATNNYIMLRKNLEAVLNYRQALDDRGAFDAVIRPAKQFVTSL